MNYFDKLSLEQEFNLRSFADQIKTLSTEQAQELSLELYRQMMLKDQFYEDLLQEYWEISSVPLSA